MKTRMKSFFVDRIAIGIAVLGIALMGASLHYNVNPVCAGALRGGIADHPVALWVLLVTTVPAMLVGSLIPAIPDPDISAPFVYFISVFACQAALFFVIGKAISGLISLLRRPKANSVPNQALHATSEPAQGEASSAHEGSVGRERTGPTDPYSVRYCTDWR